MAHLVIEMLLGKQHPLEGRFATGGQQGSLGALGCALLWYPFGSFGKGSPLEFSILGFQSPRSGFSSGFVLCLVVINAHC